MRIRTVLKAVTGVAVLGLLLGGYPVFAEESVADLKAQVEALKKRVADLESQGRQAKGPAALPQPGSMNRVLPDAWDPFSEMQRMRAEMDRMFQDAFTNPAYPSTGVFSNHLSFQSSGVEETKDGYLIKFNLAGFDKDKVDIKVNPGSISISGQQKQETKQADQNRRFESQSFGEFLQTIPLPKDADVAGMKTEKQGDDLIIHLPRRSPEADPAASREGGAGML